jgi:hypothetical protein
MKLGIEGMYLNKPISNIILNGEKLKPFPLKPRMRQGCSTLSTLIQHSLGIPSQSDKAGTRNKQIQIGKEEFKVSLFTDDMILHLKDPNNSTKKFLDTINSFSKVSDYKINLQKSVAFPYTTNEKIEKEYKKTIPVRISSNKIKYLNLKRM